MNPNPDYDSGDELEYGIAAYAWLLRGVYAPHSYAPDLGPADGQRAGLRSCQIWSGQKRLTAYERHTAFHG
jgi:hypothetical protein